jgi:hypothetical protein
LNTAVMETRISTVWGRLSLVAADVVGLSSKMGITLSSISQRSPMIHQSIREAWEDDERNLKGLG